MSKSAVYCAPTRHEVINVTGTVLAEGQSRIIYSVQDKPDLLLKVQKCTPPPRRFFQRFRALVALRRYYKSTVALRRELREYERVASEGHDTVRHLQRFERTINTNHGPALLVQAVRRQNGELGMTLRQLIASGQYDQRAHKGFSAFLHWFVTSRIVAADVHLDNIVFDELQNELVLVDGIGDKTFLPLRAWFPALNLRYKRRLAKKLTFDAAVSFMEAAIGKQKKLRQSNWTAALPSTRDS